MVLNDFKNFIHEVKAHATIREVVNFYGFKPNRAHKICCPFHGEKTPSLHIYDETNTFYCFGCGIGGDSVKFVSELCKLTAFQAAKKINIDMALSVKEPDSSRSAPAPDTKKQKQEEKAFSVWCELKDLETACINAFDELPENDSGDKMQEDLSMIRKLKGIAENFANYGDESDYNKIVGADTTISKLKRHYKEKEEDSMQENRNYITEEHEKNPAPTAKQTATKQKATANSELFEMLMNADNLTEDKIKTIKRILTDTNPYNADGTGKLNPTNLAKYLSDKGITVRYDDIKHDLEITGFKDNDIYSKEQLIPAIRFELEKYLKCCTPERITSSLTNIAMDNHYNPILELIDNAKYDGKNHLQTAYEVLGIDDNDKYDSTRQANNHISRGIFKTWLKQAYCMLHNGFCGELFAADFALVLQGRQGKGKTSFFRKLALKSEYFGEGMSLNPDNKDSIIQGLTNFILEMGEIESTFKRDISKVKALITNREDAYRLPYGQNFMKYPRLTTMCGTVNSAEFLIDDTGNRRFGVIPIYDSHDIMKHLDRLDALQLWAQIREEVNADLARGKTYANCFRDKDVQAAINARNTHFQKPLTGELEIREILEEEAAPTTDNRYKNETVYMSASQFKEVHSDKLGKLSLVQIRAVFERLGIPKEEKSKVTYDKKTSLRNTYEVPYRHLI